MKHRSLLLLAAASLGLAPLSARAHEVWIEETPAGLVLRFGEFGDSVETSPGHLDGLEAPNVWSVGQEARVETQKQKDGYLLPGVDAKKDIVAEAGYAVMAGREPATKDKAKGEPKPGRKPVFYARWHVPGQPASPALNFDIVPTGKADEFCVYFRGKPVPGIEVTAFEPDGKTQDFKANDAGVVSFKSSKPGLCMLKCKHQREDIAGFSGGLAYAQLSHNCVTVWRQP